MTRGLYSKYNITKTDGSLTDPEAYYFVLRIDNDLDALLAALGWAKAKRNDVLFEDLIDKIRELHYK